MENYFQGNKRHPQHLSVGAVVRNSKGEVLCHYFPTETATGYWSKKGITDFYILMRETPEVNEPLETALMRGIREEFNALATLDDYLGAIVADAYDGDTLFQKTTLYFLCTYTGEAHGTRDHSDAEGDSELVWKTPEFLIEKMRAQTTRFSPRTDLDESSVLERYVERTS